MKKKIINIIIVIIILAVMLFPIIKFIIEIEVEEAKYDSLKENISGKEITIIAEEYVNANIISSEWDDNILECVKQDSVKKGRFAGSLNKQYYIYRGVNAGSTEIIFIIGKYGKIFKKTYLAEVSDDLSVAIISLDESVVEDY